MENFVTIIITIVVLALIFEFINGFHDTANFDILTSKIVVQLLNDYGF